MNNNTLKDTNIKDITKLVLYPKNMDSLKNVKQNIKVYGYLEFCLGAFNSINKNKDFLIFYKDIKDAVLNKDFNSLMGVYNEIIKNAKSENEKTILNTFIIATIHKANKELGLY